MKILLIEVPRRIKLFHLSPMVIHWQFSLQNREVKGYCSTEIRLPWRSPKSWVHPNTINGLNRRIRITLIKMTVQLVKNPNLYTVTSYQNWINCTTSYRKRTLKIKHHHSNHQFRKYHRTPHSKTWHPSKPLLTKFFHSLRDWLIITSSKTTKKSTEPRCNSWFGRAAMMMPMQHLVMQMHLLGFSG